MPSHAHGRRGAIAVALSIGLLAASSTAIAQTDSTAEPSDPDVAGTTGEADATTLARDPAPRPQARLRVSRDRLKSGKKIHLRGRVSPHRRHQVRLQFKRAGSGKWQRAARTRTGAKGRFTITKRQRVTGKWRVVPKHGRPSNVRAVRVMTKLRRLKVNRSVVVGNSARISGNVLPRGKRRVVVRVGGQRMVRRTNSKGRFTARWKAGSTGARNVRIQVRGNRRAGPASRGAGKIRAFRRGHASYYGPGFYGGRTACGQTLTPSTQGVAHKTLPCGTRVTFRYRGRQTTVRVIDRGPFIPGRDWDLTTATKNRLGFGSTGTVLTDR